MKGTSHDLYRSGNRGSATSLAIVLLLFAATAAGVGWVGMGIVASDRWPIRWLELNGSFQRVSAEQLRSSLTPHMDASFFTIDLRQLNRSARRIPWVSSVRIRKQWPDTVSVSIEEYRPVAHWNEGELISASGEAFAVPGADDIQGLPWLRGPESRLDEVVAAWGEFNELMMPLALEIGRLQLDRRGAWSMTLTNGTQIRLGRDDATARLERLLTSWEVLMAGREQAPRDIDLRYTNGFAVAWPQDPEKQAGAES